MDAALIAQMKKNWEIARKKAHESGFNDVADGVYIARLSQAEVGESKNGRPQIATCWVILEGDATGEQKYDYLGLDEKGLEWTLRKLGSLGMDIDSLDPEFLPGELKKLIKDKTLAKIKLTTKGEFQNLSVMKLISPDAYDDGGPEPEEQDSGEELPEDPFTEDEPSATELEEEVLEEEGAVEFSIGQQVQFIWRDESKVGVYREKVDDDYSFVASEGKKYRVPTDNIMPVPGGSELEEE